MHRFRFLVGKDLHTVFGQNKAVMDIPVVKKELPSQLNFAGGFLRLVFNKYPNDDFIVFYIVWMGEAFPTCIKISILSVKVTSIQLAIIPFQRIFNGDSVNLFEIRLGNILRE